MPSVNPCNTKGGWFRRGLAWMAGACSPPPGITRRRLWDANTGQALGQPMRHEAALKSAQFSPNGRWLVTASDDGTARLWDASTGQAVGEPMKHEDAVVSAQFSPDGRRVVTASADNTGRLCPPDFLDQFFSNRWPKPRVFGEDFSLCSSGGQAAARREPRRIGAIALKSSRLCTSAIKASASIAILTSGL